MWVVAWVVARVAAYIHGLSSSRHISNAKERGSVSETERVSWHWLSGIVRHPTRVCGDKKACS